MTGRIGIAVVGAGLLGRRHARVWDEASDTELRAVVDVDERRAREVADAHAVGWATDTDRILADDSVHAVSVATPDHLHRDLVVDAVAAGKHVFVEKPLATTLADAEAIVAASRRHERVVQVNFSQRWLAPYAYLKRVIDDGEIGQPQLVVSVKRDRLSVPTKLISWASATSPVFFMTSHDLDLIRWYLGAEPVSVSAQETRGVLTAEGIAAADAVQALVRFDGGVSVSLSTGWIHPDTYPLVAEDRLEIVGSEGVVEYRSREGVVEVHTTTSARTVEFSGPATASEVDGRLRGAFVDSCHHFLDSLRQGRSPSTAAADSLTAVACQELILRSAREHGRSLEVSTARPTTISNEEASRP